MYLNALTHGQLQVGTVADAVDGAYGGSGAWAAHQPTSSSAQGLSIPAAQCGSGAFAMAYQWLEISARSISTKIRLDVLSVLLYATLSLPLSWTRVEAGQVEISIEDPSPYHVYPPGRPFTVGVRIEYQGPVAVSYYWTDFRGQRLTEPISLRPGGFQRIQSPGSTIGFYGLVFSTSDVRLTLPDRQPGEDREYGFAILAPRSTSERSADPASRFGVVHADIQDPYLPVWVKTMTWNTTSPRRWGFEINKRRSVGLLELPIVVGAEWRSDDSRPISPAQLKKLRTRIERYFESSSATHYWEAGIEENLGKRYHQLYYWPNLKAKIMAIRQAVDAINPNIKLIYQVAERDLSAIQVFLQSDAAKVFDILSLHPYAWPDFPTPEEWLEEFLRATQRMMLANGFAMPIWFTEVGAPHHGTYPGGLFGYPDRRTKVTGQTRYGAAIYMIKLHVMALHQGVQKIFWYNYIDRRPEREYAENHFGMRDYWDYPKPVYPAYFNLHSCLNGKVPARAVRLHNNVRIVTAQVARKSIAFPTVKNG
jgi:hypothetical protein